MQYKYAREAQDYSDLSSGRVLYSLPGHPAFPVRLASEIFQRCVAFRLVFYEEQSPCTLYDPCCGTAYLLTILALLHSGSIRRIIGSDIDEKAVDLAKKNLGLIDPAGMERRIDEIARMIEQYNKDSHKDALKSASNLQHQISALRRTDPLTVHVFQANALDAQTIANNIAGSVDIVMTDVPYGRHSQWGDKTSDSLGSMLDALAGSLSPTNVVAIISDKQQKASHPGYQRIEQFQVGKRRVVLLRKP